MAVKRSSATEMGSKIRAAGRKAQERREMVNTGDGGVLWGDCALEVDSGQEERRGECGEQSEEIGKEHSPAKRKNYFWVKSGMERDVQVEE